MVTRVQQAKVAELRADGWEDDMASGKPDGLVKLRRKTSKTENEWEYCAVSADGTVVKGRGHEE